MDPFSWEHLHLLTHPFPLVLSIVGATAGIAGWALGREELERYGLLSLLLGGIMTIPAYLTGLTAADLVADRIFVRASAMGTHRIWGTWATLSLLTTGIFAAFSLFQPGDRRLRRFVFLLGLVAAGVVAYAGFLGGDIRHVAALATIGGMPAIPGGSILPIEPAPDAADP